jgi:L-alanine-DL-glutamate epimerase-like enolase superfamily enzyme
MRRGALRRRYGRADGADRSTNPTVVEYAVQDLFKGKSPAAAAKHTAKKLSGGTNMFLGPGITTIDPKALEAALWDRMAEYAARGVPKYTGGREHYALGGTLQFFKQTPFGGVDKPAARAKLKALVIAKLGHNPFTSDDGA